MRRVREPKFRKRVVESKIEKDVIRAENRERMDKYREEKANERDEQAKLDAVRDSPPVDGETGEAWTPPRTMGEFMELVQGAHPNWNWAAQRKLAHSMWKRHEVVEKAFTDGFKMLRDLRERHEHGLGWWWPSLHDLEPIERTQVCAALKRILRKSGVRI